MTSQAKRLQITTVSPGLLVIQHAGGGLTHCSASCHEEFSVLCLTSSQEEILYV